MKKTIGKGINMMHPGCYVWPPWKELKLEDLVHDAIVKVDDMHAAVLGENVFLDVMLDTKDAMEVNANNMKEMIQDSTQAVWKACSINCL